MKSNLNTQIARLVLSLGVFSLLAAIGCTTTGGTANRSGSASATRSATPTTAPITARTNDQPLVAVPSLNGLLRSIGSDTMDRQLLHWEEAFRAHHPGVRFRHEGKGTSTAIPALAEGRSDVGPMSRTFKAEEIELFQSRYGYAPTIFAVGVDSLAVYVHPDNPLADRGLTLAQIDAIFSSTRRGGHPQDIVTWGQLGLTGEWANKPIVVYSRNTASGTYGFFKDVALKGGTFKSSNYEMDGSAAVVEAVASDRYAIGYSGIAYRIPGVVTVPLAANPGGMFYEPNEANANDGNYPLARNLFLAVNRDPQKGLSPIVAGFLRFVLSPEGQELVRKEGYYPLTSGAVLSETAKIQ